MWLSNLYSRTEAASRLAMKHVSIRGDEGRWQLLQLSFRSVRVQ